MFADNTHGIVIMKFDVRHCYVLIDFFKEEFNRLRTLSYGLGIDVVFLVFAIISPDSFENIEEKWIPEINHFLINVPRILVGTKSGK